MRSLVEDGSASAADFRKQIDRILHSSEFSGSEVLRNLLSFLARHSVESPGRAVKEYELAVSVLGRPKDFDPRLDSAVRVHTARLRAKLAEYYMSDGADDAILVEVPKGPYHLVWRHRGADAAPEFSRAADGTTAPGGPARARLVVAFIAGAVLAASALGAWMTLRSRAVPAIVNAFWQPFFESQQPPIIVYSNHRFIGTSSTGLRAFRDGVDSPADSNDTYSGTGTVMAVGELSGLFSQSGHTPRLKRAELLTWDEAREANVVFVGAPEANSRLKEMAPLKHFAFKSSLEEPQYGTGAILNLHPVPGEESIYLGSARPYAYDYFIIAMLPNLHPERKVLILAGTNTYGCQAGAEFVTRGDLLETLYRRLNAQPGKPLPDFEALVKVNVSGGVPVQPSLVAVRLHGGHP